MRVKFNTNVSFYLKLNSAYKRYLLEDAVKSNIVSPLKRYYIFFLNLAILLNFFKMKCKYYERLSTVQNLKKLVLYMFKILFKFKFLDRW